MKRGISLLLIIGIMILGLSACELSNGPKEVADKFLKAFDEVDVETIKELCDSDVELDDDYWMFTMSDDELLDTYVVPGIELSDNTKKSIIESLNKIIDMSVEGYSIDDVSEYGDNATVEATVDTKSADESIEENDEYKEMMSEYEDTDDFENINYEEMAVKMYDFYAKALEKMEPEKEKITLKLVKKDGKWLVSKLLVTETEHPVPDSDVEITDISDLIDPKNSTEYNLDTVDGTYWVSNEFDVYTKEDEDMILEHREEGWDRVVAELVFADQVIYPKEQLFPDDHSMIKVYCEPTDFEGSLKKASKVDFRKFAKTVLMETNEKYEVLETDYAKFIYEEYEFDGTSCSHYITFNNGYMVEFSLESLNKMTDEYREWLYNIAMTLKFEE